jgi:hypothetical protein
MQILPITLINTLQENISEILPVIKMESYKQLWNLTPAKCINKWIFWNTDTDVVDLSLVSLL